MSVTALTTFGCVHVRVSFTQRIASVVVRLSFGSISSGHSREQGSIDVAHLSTFFQTTTVKTSVHSTTGAIANAHICHTAQQRFLLPRARSTMGDVQWWTLVAEKWAGFFSSSIQKVQKQVRCPAHHNTINSSLGRAPLLPTSPGPSLCP